MRSVVVVLPASMCAMMPILRSLFSGVLRAITAIYSRLPAIMSEGLVGLCHTMGVFLFLDSVAFIAARGHQLARQTVCHGLVAARTRIRHQPLHRERRTAFRADFHRNLVRRTTDT